jgi:hypothetical protein
MRYLFVGFGVFSALFVGGSRSRAGRSTACSVLRIPAAAQHSTAETVSVHLCVL